MTKAALVLVCKRPASGIGKQRLAASLGLEAASRIAEALLACALEDAGDWPGPVIIAPAHPEDYAWGGALLPQRSKVHIEPQTTGNLGQRLNALDHKLRMRGLEQLVYIGSDAPLLGAADYAAAGEALLEHDVVLKPAADGGVVLMASRQPWPMLSGLPWSTVRLGAALADCCRAAGKSIATLTHSFDVDQQDDVVRLIAALKTDQRPARSALRTLACDLIHSKEENHV
ncbi:TIGR04282 family arsenosugar biosynthesis glycosyltransferase [Nitrosovibrio sp. Nv4]|uniref:TIGR04282 family arsenosugar biosynthesis glycosyltransferase n=1 Tax=Nitrosovibrio sp. Nv4 TaxID=1945880 RepID=UPI000BC43668|nr:DUF2064 domain-containing protein [Nitrosovibrio sp. Nv4]SOD40372.1 hypothetical protein SAMN06298226_0633 [Nitrosovibrio sp. Nv4]